MTTHRALAPLCAVLVLAMASSAVAQVGMSSWYNGISTWYGASDTSVLQPGTTFGYCQMLDLPYNDFPHYMIAALSPISPFVKAPLYGCGMCFQVKCRETYRWGRAVCRKDRPNGMVVMIPDKCPECGSNHVDLGQYAFGQIAQVSAGIIDISYRRVACQTKTKLKINVIDHQGFYIAMSAKGLAGYGTVQNFQIRGAGDSSWMQLNRGFTGRWEKGGFTPPRAPLDVRVTSEAGLTITCHNVVPTNGKGTWSCKTNFPSVPPRYNRKRSGRRHLLDEVNGDTVEIDQDIFEEYFHNMTADAKAEHQQIFSEEQAELLAEEEANWQQTVNTVATHVDDDSGPRNQVVDTPQATKMAVMEAKAKQFMSLSSDTSKHGWSLRLVNMTWDDVRKGMFSAP